MLNVKRFMTIASTINYNIINIMCYRKTKTWFCISQLDKYWV